MDIFGRIVGAVLVGFTIFAVGLLMLKASIELLQWVF